MMADISSKQIKYAGFGIFLKVPLSKIITIVSLLSSDDLGKWFQTDEQNMIICMGISLKAVCSWTFERKFTVLSFSIKLECFCDLWREETTNMSETRATGLHFRGFTCSCAKLMLNIFSITNLGRLSFRRHLRLLNVHTPPLSTSGSYNYEELDNINCLSPPKIIFYFMLKFLSVIETGFCDIILIFSSFSFILVMKKCILL